MEEKIEFVAGKDLKRMRDFIKAEFNMLISNNYWETKEHFKADYPDEQCSKYILTFKIKKQ
jgi:hypothetical protein